MPFASIQNNSLHYSWLNYQRTDTLVLINSLGTNFNIWNALLTLLTENYNVLLHDKQGHGLSSLANDFDMTIDVYADDIISLMDYLEIDEAHIVGLSIGGLITFSLAKRYPQRCKKLVFSNTGFKIGTKEGWEDRIRTIEAKGLQSISEMVMKRWLSEDFFKSQPAQVSGYTRMFNQTSKKGYVAACNAISDADYSSVAENMTFDSLFIAGKNDLSTTPQFVKSMADRTKGATYTEMDDVGHLPGLEKPMQYAQLIKEFIA